MPVPGRSPRVRAAAGTLNVLHVGRGGSSGHPGSPAASGREASIEAIEGAFGADADCAIPSEIHGFLKTLLKMRVYEKLETGGSIQRYQGQKSSRNSFRLMLAIKYGSV